MSLSGFGLLDQLEDAMEWADRAERRTCMMMLVAIALVSLATKGMIVLETTPDFRHYVHQVGVVLETGRTSLPQPPTTYYLLAALGLLTTPEGAVRVFMILASTLAIVPAYLFGHRFSGARMGGVVCAAVAVMNPYLYLMCKYSILRNILGNTLIYALLYAVGRWHGDWTNRRRAVIGAMIWTIALTHVLAFCSAVLYCLLYVARQRSKARMPIVAVCLIVVPLILVATFDGAPWMPYVVQGNLPLTFNFPRFFEAFRDITVSLSVLAGALVTHFYASPVGAWLLSFHLLSWVLHQGLGERLLFMTYVPLSAVLPALVVQDRDSKLWLFLSACMVLQYLSRFVPGGWP